MLAQECFKPCHVGTYTFYEFVGNFFKLWSSIKIDIGARIRIRIDLKGWIRFVVVSFLNLQMSQKAAE